MKASTVLGPELLSVPQARQFVVARLREWECDKQVELAKLLTSELVANAIVHARSSVELVIECDVDRLHVEVRDSSPELPCRRAFSVGSLNGRGLNIVHRMSAAWGVRLMRSGKSVWFEVPAA